MDWTGPDNPDIMFIGEAPGANEDDQDEQFVGRSGAILREAIELLELSNVAFQNTIRCRPPGNKTPTKRQIEYCSQLLEEDLKEADPAVIVLLGNAPLSAVLGVTGITAYNGQVIQRDNRTYVPAFHPSYILRNHTEENLKSWWAALEVAAQAAAGKKFKRADAHYEYVYPETVSDLEFMRDELLCHNDVPVAYDIETDSLRPEDDRNRILTLAFANDQAAWSFPLDHPESWWDDDEWKQVVDIIEEILTGCKIITHTKFDCKLTRAILGIDFEQYGDTFHLSALLNAHHHEHGLKRLAGLHLRMFDYDKELDDYKAEHPECDPENGGTYANVPLDILLPYGGMDVSATWMLEDVLFPQLTKKQQALYRQMIVPADYSLGRMEEFGFNLDVNLILRYKAVYEAIQHRYLLELLSFPEVQDFIHDSQFEALMGYCHDRLGISNDELTYFVDNGLDKWYNDNLELLEKLPDAEWRKLYYQKVYMFVEQAGKALATKTSRAKLPEFKFNPGSSIQIKELLFNRLGYPVHGTTNKGEPSIKVDYLKEAIFDYEEDGREDELRPLKAYMGWKLLAGILSKTFKPMLSDDSDWYNLDGRVRSRYTLGGAKTGRIASSQPNLQNIPSVESEPGTVLQYLPVKNAFTHTWPGGCLLMADYSGMELRVMASVAGIKGMIEVFKRGGDVHRYVSSLIYKIPEEYITKFQRYRGKWCNWSLLYMGGWWTLYRLYRINGLTKDEAMRIADLYFEAFPELPKFHKRTIKFIQKNKYAESPFGRILKLPEVDDRDERRQRKALRTGVNMRIQGTASDTLMAAMYIIDHYMIEEGLRSRMVNTVHDSLVTDIYPGELETVRELQRDVMENVCDYAKDFMPGLDFSWLKVPLVADFDVGTHYGTYGSISDIVCDECGCKEFEKVYETVVGNQFKFGCSCMKCGNVIPNGLDGVGDIMLYNQLSCPTMDMTGNLRVETRQPKLYAQEYQEEMLT
jgi:uracil-DNA glycosylase family 4